MICDVDLGEHAGVTTDAALGHCGVGLVQFDTDAVAAETIADKARRAGAEEWIEYYPSTKCL